MKKLLTLLIASSLLFACSNSSSDWDDDSNNGKGTTTQLGKTTTPIPASEWKGEADINKFILPLMGQWVLTHENGKATNRFLAYQFGGGLWHNLKTKPREGEAAHFNDWVRYVFNEKQIKERDSGIIYDYTASADLSTMTLFDGSNTLGFKKYDNNGVWKWNGDWNDKNNPYYAVYNGKYNPVKGEWKVVIDGGYNVKYNEYFWFKDSFYLYTKIVEVEADDIYRSIGEYNVNDIGIYTTSQRFNLLGYSTNKYWIKGDTLYLQGVNASNKLEAISKLVRIK